MRQPRRFSRRLATAAVVGTLLAAAVPSALAAANDNANANANRGSAAHAASAATQGSSNGTATPNGNAHGVANQAPPTPPTATPPAPPAPAAAAAPPSSNAGGNGNGAGQSNKVAPAPAPATKAAASGSTATGGPGSSTQGCDGSHHSNTGHGANQSGAYDNTCDGRPSANGSGSGVAGGRPCMGCVGNADDKNPPGQRPNGSDNNAGYECDRNKGIGKGNPAHTSCVPTTPPCVPTADKPCTPPPACVPTPTVPCVPVSGCVPTPTVPCVPIAECVPTPTAPCVLIPACIPAPFAPCSPTSAACVPVASAPCQTAAPGGPVADADAPAKDDKCVEGDDDCPSAVAGVDAAPLERVAAMLPFTGAGLGLLLALGAGFALVGIGSRFAAGRR